MKKIIIIFIIGSIVYFSLLTAAFKFGIQYGKDYMVTNYKIVGINFQVK